MAAGRNPWPLYVALIVSTALADQVSKIVVMRSIARYEHITVIPGFFDLVHTLNTGAAWGMFAGRQFGLAIVSAVVFVLLLVYHRKFTGGWAWRQWSLGLILGGVIGNMYDRLFRDGVVDFVHVYYKTWAWPAFNIADSAIVVGVCIYIYHSFRWPQPKAEYAPPNAEPVDDTDTPKPTAAER